MVFSDTTNDDGIVQEARWLVNANATSYTLKDITRNANRWLDKAVSVILEADGRWQFDDTNQSGEAVYSQNLVSGTQSYDILATHLRITRVEIKNSDGNYVRLQPIDQNEVDGTLTDFQSTDGTPMFYDLIGNDIVLYPAPNYASTNGLKYWFQRAGSYFATTDTTKTPGFASIFHRYITLGCALDYALKNNLETRVRFKEEVLEMEQSIQHFYNRRAGDENIVMNVRKHDFE